MEIARNVSQGEIFTKPGCENLYFEPLPFVEGREVFINGRRHEFTMLALQGYIGEVGSVDLHKERNDVTEMYFPLCGNLEVSVQKQGVNPNTLERDILTGTYTWEEVSRSYMRLIQGEEPLLVVAVNGKETVIRPTILPPGLKHASKKVGSETGINPLFLALKAKQSYTPAEIREKISTSSLSTMNTVQWGSGHLTKLEWEMVCKMKTTLGSWEAVRDNLRQGNRILPTYVSDFEVVEAGVVHGCPIITDLMLGPRTNEDVFQGYTEKNRGFRAFAKMMRDENRADLLSAWTGIEEKQSTDFSPLNVQYGTPKELQGKLAGNAKIEPFWVSQILRVLEDTRMGRRKDIPTSLIDKFAMPWEENFLDIIKSPSTRTIQDVTVKTIGRIADILHTRGVKEKYILLVLTNGLPITSMLNEHGQVEKMKILTGRVANELVELKLQSLSKSFQSYAEQQIEAYMGAKTK
ncbi:hypothetical protein HGA88_04080 [Candidatus Roizmanbacteria bacterium]|nr:hypothetical protein [Candidatus Roizmanbacteria bacterium]